MLFPVRCVLCGGVGPLCDRCVETLPPPPPISAPDSIDALITLFSYRGSGRTVVAAAKYRNARPVLRWGGDALGARAALLQTPVRWVTWVPCSHGRWRTHGYDPGEVLARAAARTLGVAARSAFTRGRGPSQTKRRRAERLTGPVLDIRGRVRAGPVLIVDDVLTTGASIDAAATALRQSGCSGIVAATLAATPG